MQVRVLSGALKGNKMYLAKWSWKNEFKIFLVNENVRKFAKAQARSFAGEGGTLELERFEWEAAPPKERNVNVFMIVSSEDAK